MVERLGTVQKRLYTPLIFRGWGGALHFVHGWLHVAHLV